MKLTRASHFNRFIDQNYTTKDLKKEHSKQGEKKAEISWIHNMEGRFGKLNLHMAY